MPDDEGDDNNSSDLSLQAPLLVEAQEAVNLPIVVGGIDNSPVLQSQLYSHTSKIDGLDIFSSSQIGTKCIANSDYSIKQVSPSHISTIQLSPFQPGFSQVGETVKETLLEPTYLGKI